MCYSVRNWSWRYGAVCCGILALMVASVYAELVVPADDFFSAPQQAAPGFTPLSPPAPRENGTTSSNEERADLLELVNGDRLNGMLIAVNPSEYGLRWKHASVESPIDFALNAVAKVKLAPRKTKSIEPTDGARLRLTNSDLLSGNLVALNETNLTLNTGYAGTMAIKRTMLKMLEPNCSFSSTIYSGPTDLSNWTLPNRSTPSWTFKKGALYSTSSQAIGRNIDNMPDMANIKFDVAWQHGYPQFYFAFFTDNLTSRSGNAYALRVSGTSIYMYRLSRNGGSNNFPNNADFQDLMKIKNAKFNLLVDRKEHRFTLLINGRLIKQWTDTRESPGDGKGILFDPQSSQPIKISNITITKWDGTVPSGEAEVESVSKEDTILFMNDDKVSGKLKSIEDGVTKLETSYAALDIPLARISRIDMSTETAELARRNASDIRAHFTDDGVVTMELTNIEDNKVKGSSENFGMATMPLGAFDVLEFNIYRRNADDEDDGTF